MCVLKIEPKKTIKYWGQVKRDPIKMWKIFAALNADLKKYLIVIHIKKSRGKANIFLPEGTVTAVNVGMLGLKS